MKEIVSPIFIPLVFAKLYSNAIQFGLLCKEKVIPININFKILF